MGKIVISVFTTQCSYINRVRWPNYAPSTRKFPIEYVCQKLWKIIDRWQTYYHTHCVQFFLAHPVGEIVLWKPCTLEQILVITKLAEMWNLNVVCFFRTRQKQPLPPVRRLGQLPHGTPLQPFAGDTLGRRHGQPSMLSCMTGRPAVSGSMLTWWADSYDLQCSIHTV